jgi:hypothetical protein
VLDTAYGRWLDLPLARVELIVALDFPRWLSLYRLSRRTILGAIDGRPLCNGNRESFRHLFSRESILLWHFKTFSRKRRRIRDWEVHPPAPQLVRLTSPRHADNWLARHEAQRRVG